MANPEHVALVRKGAKAIDEWRRAHPKQKLNLSGADLSGASLSEANLSEANLREADLSGAKLNEANLGFAVLERASLSRAKLFETNLIGANLGWTDLRWANLWRANLREADLNDANLSDANLSWANVWGANLEWANLKGANLVGANLGEADLIGANLAQVRLGPTSLGGIDFSPAKGLATVNHAAPSSVGVDTLIASFRGAGNKLTPELTTFFRGAGVPQELLDELPGIVGKAEYYSCFISYGQPDLEFATKLYEDLKASGISCWLYEMDKTVGKRTWSEIGESRRGADRFVVLCSAAALVRPGVRKEIEEQIDEDPDKLMPISLDDLWTQPGFLVVRDGRDLKPFLMERNRPDFSGWDSEPARYDKALEELLKGLRRPAVKKARRKKG